MANIHALLSFLDTRYMIYLTAWMDDLASQPAYKSRKTPQEVKKIHYLIKGDKRNKKIKAIISITYFNDHKH